MIMAKHKSMLWECPTCGRKFAKKNQWHSCNPHTVSYHFQGKNPVLKETYEVLISKLQEFGQIRIDAVKSSINLINKYHFGGM